MCSLSTKAVSFISLKLKLQLVKYARRAYSTGKKFTTERRITMGAWGTGPFDSDGGLDYLGNLANTYAKETDDGELYDINQDEIKQRLSSLFKRAVAHPDENWAIAQDLYAGIGLVAANLVDVPEENTGTRLFNGNLTNVNAENNLNLDAHCGYKKLVNNVDSTLAHQANEAAETLLADEEWINSWYAREEIIKNLKTLQNILTMT